MADTLVNKGKSGVVLNNVDNTVFVPPGGDLQAAIDALAGKCSVTQPGTIFDYTGDSYTFDARVNVIRAAKNYKLPSTGISVGMRSNAPDNYKPDGNQTNYFTATNGHLGYTVAMRVQMPNDCHGVRLVFCNEKRANASVPGNSIYVKAALQPTITGLDPVPVFFNGQRTAKIEPGGFVVSDPCGINIAASTASQYTRVRYYVSVANIGELIYGTHFDAMGDSTAIDNIRDGDVVDGDADSGSQLFFIGYFAPRAVLGIPNNYPTPTVLLLGDSIMTAGMSQGFRSGLAGTSAFCKPLIDHSIPHLCLAAPGDSAKAFTNTNRTGTQLMDGYTHAVINFGRNDLVSIAYSLNTLAEIEAFITGLWARLAKYGCKVYAATITPYSLVNMVNAGYTADQAATIETSRLAINDLIRTIPDNIAGYIDMAAIVEKDSSHRDEWKTGYSTDGIHPNATGRAAMNGATVYNADGTTWTYSDCTGFLSL